MRGFQILGAGLWLLLAAATSGCFLDEIDKAQQWSQKREEAPPPAADSGAPGEGEKVNWWASAKSLGSEESKTDIVQCKVGNSTQFMERQACLGRGGKPQ